MLERRWAKVSVCTVAALVAGVLQGAAAAPPAGATDTLSFLQVTPEVTTVGVGADVTLTARLFVAGAAVRTPAPGGASGVTVNFDFEGGPLDDEAPKTCAIGPTASTCSITVASSTSGMTLVRTWTNGASADHPDRGEGRLASDPPSTDAPAADCIGTAEGDVDPAVCRAGDTVAQGNFNEPDSTDVVRVTWLNRGVDVQPDDQVKVRGEPAAVTAAAYDIEGKPAPGTVVKFEIFNGSVSDPAGGNTPANPDRTCTTGADGTCAIALSQAATGVDVLCAWTSAAVPVVLGAAPATATCDGEGVLDSSANDGKPSPADDDQDVVRITWTPPPEPTGYWLVGSDGGVFAFGDAAFRGSTGGLKLNQPMVGMATAPGVNGYWLVASDGGVFAFGDAVFRGSAGGIKLNRPIVGMAATPSGRGYWIVGADGGVFAFGDAAFRGSAGRLRLTQPIVGMATTPTGRGYWLAAADGGVFAYGDAAFRGSAGRLMLTQPIVGMAATPSGQGYWLVAADGGVFAYGDAAFRGSTGALKLVQPMVGMSRTTSGAGYRLVARDGGVFAYGDAPFRGSTGATRLNAPIVGTSGF